MSGEAEIQPLSVTDLGVLAREESPWWFQGGRARNLFNYIILVELYMP